MASNKKAPPTLYNIITIPKNMCVNQRLLKELTLLYIQKRIFSPKLMPLLAVLNVKSLNPLNCLNMKSPAFAGYKLKGLYWGWDRLPGVIGMLAVYNGFIWMLGGGRVIFGLGGFIGDVGEFEGFDEVLSFVFAILDQRYHRFFRHVKCPEFLGHLRVLHIFTSHFNTCTCFYIVFWQFYYRNWCFVYVAPPVLTVALCLWD